MIWLFWFLWHINHFGYLKPNPLYTHILNILGFGLVGFSTIPTTVDYLMPNPVYTYILNIYMVCYPILLITFLNEPELFFAHSQMVSSIATKQSQFNINHLFAGIVCSI